MTDLVLKPSHKEWRKLVKKLRRKRIRQKLAEVRKAQERLKENSPTYLLQVEKRRLLEEHELEKELKEREEQHRKWLCEEERAQKQWREEQRLKGLALEEKLKEQERIRKEWEIEQKKIQEKKEKLEALKKEEQRKQQELLDRINDFISNDGDIPPELQVISETNPGKEVCTFYQKVGSCRFGNQCSRNHKIVKISNTLMFINFYSHFTLDQNHTSEYDTDISLEYEDSDMYLHFKDFYNDIVPEFKRFGEVTMVKVCCNSEFHLRGNVYVQYRSQREALIAYKSFQGRWYGGKQLNIDFVDVRDWGAAICGDFFRHRCPKGKSCNFLHVFKNPKNEFNIEWTKHRNNSQSARETFEESNSKGRHWRWSESPEPSPKKSRRHSSTDSSRRKRSKERQDVKKENSQKRTSTLKEREKSERSNNDKKSERKKRRSSSRNTKSRGFMNDE